MNVGIITAGALYLAPLRRELLRGGHRCQAYAFASTFLAGAERVGYDMVVINWAVLAQGGDATLRRLRQLLGRVPVLVAQVPSCAELDFTGQEVHWYRGPVTTQALLGQIARLSPDAELVVRDAPPAAHASVVRLPTLGTARPAARGWTPGLLAS